MKIIFGVILVVLSFMAHPLLAAPAPPQILINEGTKECAKFYAGDECVSCVRPDGWAIYPAPGVYQCPDGYTEVKIKPVCYPQKNHFCCTKGHSGAPGNCKDLAVNEKEKKCAFIDDIDKCSIIPEGWQRPKTLVCPSLNYQWLGSLKCEMTTGSETEDVMITLERTLCFGTCPVYKLTISGDGTVVYEGKDHVRIKGRQTSVITKEKVRELISAFEKVNYFSLKDSYEERHVTDFPYAITSIRINGKEKTIRHYGADRSAPKELIELEKKIDEIAGSKKWIKENVDKNPAITGEEAEEIIWELPEVKLRAERIRKGGARPFTRVESEPEAGAKPGTIKAAYTVYFGEDHETHTVREITFLVDAYTRKISVYDAAKDSAIPLETWCGRPG